MHKLSTEIIPGERGLRRSDTPAAVNISFGEVNILRYFLWTA
jgi:hypothetical protein